MLSWLNPYLAWGLHVKLPFPGNSSKLIQSQFSLIIFCDNIRHVGSTKSNVDRAPRAHTAHGARNVLNKLCNHMHYQERNSSRRTGSLCALYVFSYGHISKGHLTALSWLSHFRVLKNLTFKTRLNAKLFWWKWVLLHENRPYSRYLPSFHAFNWWDERKVTWFLTYLIRVLQYSILNFALHSP